MTRNNKAISKVHLISQKRDRDAETALRNALPAGLGDSGEVHVVTVEYERDGATIREEVNLIYSRGQPLRAPVGSSWSYTIITSAIVSGPPEGFAEARSLLYSIASSLTPTAQWHYASQQVLLEIQTARHEQNMQNIHRWGQSILKAGQEFSKLSDAQLNQWKKDQKVDDEKQRDRVRRIYDIYTQTTADGSKVGVPLGHDHLYKTNDGKFVASQNAIPNNPNLTPVEMK
jgi:hypothetical protein